MRERTRLLVALLLGLVLLALVLPWSPWMRPSIGLGQWRHLLLLALTAATAWAIPPRSHPADNGRADATLLGIGLLLLLQPVLHLILLVWAGRVASPSLLSLVLPPPDLEPMTLLPVLVRLVVLPAIIEEWCFRGRLFDYLRARLGPGHALGITTLAFAAAHGSMLSILLALPSGLLFGCLRLVGRSWWACALVHAVHNLLFLVITGFAAVTHLPLVLMVAGIWLVAVALGWHYWPQPRNQRRILLGSIAAMALCFLFHSAHRSRHDRLWIAAAGYQLAHPANPVPLVLERIAPEQRRRILDRRRRLVLAEHLLAGPWALPDERLLPLLALLDPAALEAQADDAEAAVDLVHRLADLPLDHPAVSRMARRICRRQPAAFAALVMDRYWMLPEWFPAGTARDDLVDLLAATGDRRRQMLLARIREIYGPEEQLACMFAVPAAAISARDRHWLFTSHRHAAELLETAFADDPERAQAWSPPAWGQ